MNWIKNITISSIITLVCLLAIELSVAYFYNSVDPYIFKEWMKSRPKALQDDPDFEVVLMGFDGQCNYPTPIHDNGLSTYEGDWSCGEVTFSNGNRLTKPKPESWNQTIHVFGGSTVWGRGALDDKTIPSILQESLISKNVRVLNYGMISYVAKQENDILFSKRADIKKGDIIIYNDGFNDFYNGVMYNNPDGFIIGYNEKNKAKVYEHRLKAWLYQNIYTYRLVSDLKHGRKRPTNTMECSIDGKVAESRISQAAEHFGNRINEAREIAESLGAVFYHFYQPSLLDSRDFTEYESQIFSHYPCMRLAEPLKKKYNIAFLSKNKKSIDQTHLLVGTDLFFDYVHTAYAGNKIIADNILKTLLDDNHIY